ncbi:hypothetical protein AB1Y20_014998 [Prymnesium parvum]|uniref:cellulose 1,4-beta-cellobiosidase (non-reducing end) n=1 Tax=Prymnesium parvum TaxID=97485 RepID=A0AB34JX64_PRYPA
MVPVLALICAIGAPNLSNRSNIPLHGVELLGRHPGVTAAAQGAYVKTTRYGPYPEGFAQENYNGYEGTIQGTQTKLSVAGNVRAYWVNDSTKHSWAQISYKKFNVLGKALQFTVDMSGVDCGCNAAFYLVAMDTTSTGESGYCDIQGGGGRACLEVDILEGNRKAIQSTLHTQQGSGTDGTCNSYGCASNWGKNDQGNYGTQSAVDSSMPYDVSASFDGSGHMNIDITQGGQVRNFWSVATAGNGRPGVPEDASQRVAQAMRNGMVLVVSLWKASDNMAWLNGACNSNYPVCDLNSAQVVYSNLRVVGDVAPSPPLPPSPPPPPPSPPSPPSPPHPPPATTCNVKSNTQCLGNDIRNAQWVNSSAECCSLCLKSLSCVAWTYDRGYDQLCHLKGSCISNQYDDNCDSGFTSSPTSDVCTMQSNTRCNGNDIRDAGVADSAAACCSICQATEGCKAWTWDRGYDRHCNLKTVCSWPSLDSNTDSGVLNPAQRSR